MVARRAVSAPPEAAQTGADVADSEGGEPMAMTLTLGHYFEAWRSNHLQTDDELAEYLGVTASSLAALAAELVEPAGPADVVRAEATRPMPPPPLSTDLDGIAARYGVNDQRLRDVIHGRY